MKTKKLWWRECEDGWWVLCTTDKQGRSLKLYGWPTDEESKRFLKLLNKEK